MQHIPVLLNEVNASLQLKRGDSVVDCTLGDGGHAKAIMETIGRNGKLLAIDADVQAILQARRYLYGFDDSLITVRDNFVNLKEIISKQGFKNISAVLMDLGWSSTQFTERQRGFSFQNPDESLDMRYDSGQAGGDKANQRTAAEILNNYSEQELADIFRRYGEEKFGPEIAAEIATYRKTSRIAKVGQLVEIVLSVYARKFKNKNGLERLKIKGFRIHPATQIFQALRVETNNELEVLRQALPQAIEILKPGGRLAVISFHSLEDRIVKQYFRTQDGKTLKIVNKKPVVASRDELKTNPRARSAKLRVVEKIST